MKTVIVTKPEHEKGLEVFQNLRPGYEIVTSDSDEESLAVAISSTGAKATIVGTDKYQGRLYEALSSSGIISRFGVGTDGINFRKIAKHGLLLANTPHSTDDSVAELAMWLIGDLARMVNYLDKQVRANSFSGETGREIKGKHLGIIGFGSIGKKVARIASYGFNMRVHGFGRS